VAVSKALRRGNYVRARYITESAWLKKPKGNGKLYALVLMHSGEFEDAERVLEEELLQLNFNASPFPTHRAYIAADLLALLARISLRRKRVDRALYLYRSAVGLCPTHPLALTGLSEVYLSSGKSIERAIRMLNTAKVLTCVQLFERFLLPHRRVRVLGALAWANALAGNFSKADALLLSGLNNSSRIISAEKALLFARAAFVRALEQRYLEAGAYLSIASEYDSFGYVGGKARLRLSRESLLFPLR
jgi:tetratricopeptide (TPR) repeat protein